MKSPAASSGLDVAQLVRDHQAGVWRYLRVLGCDANQAEDFTQETFLTVLQKPPEDRGPAAMACYLRTVARNLLISAQRRDARLKLVDNVDEIDSQWRRLAGADDGGTLLAALEACFAALSPRAQTALNLRFRDRQTRAEIAAALQMTEHGAKNLMQRAKQTLRECVERRAPK